MEWMLRFGLILDTVFGGSTAVFIYILLHPQTALIGLALLLPFNVIISLLRGKFSIGPRAL